MDKKDRVRQQLRLCAGQMQQLLDQLNPAHNISQSLKNTIAQIQHFNKFDQPNVISLWQHLLHEPRPFPFRTGEFNPRGEAQSLLDRRAQRNLMIPILVVDTSNNREEGLPGVQKKLEAFDSVDELHGPPLRLKTRKKRRNTDDDELTQADHGNEEDFLGVEKKIETHNIIDKMHDSVTKWKIIRKRMNDDYDGDDELNQPQPKRTRLSKKQWRVSD
ncbi:uncharacterized protein FPRO_15940 [Fusarium proliferatum ET1]|uniref:Uncharacterized protein n=1 Tax=Fusarium proliferatum (strain ET1) TaxID=1227346 RepID=A0A1L7WAG7_FUSPR|nr:uncharacterized protein FPRO_15940 [Fusarium proliferatum ET1]CZR49581.1 uncharacterized protein FPRO_15940 [Fusarium proliferatum ET1]